MPATAGSGPRDDAGADIHACGGGDVLARLRLLTMTLAAAAEFRMQRRQALRALRK